MTELAEMLVVEPYKRLHREPPAAVARVEYARLAKELNSVQGLIAHGLFNDIEDHEIAELFHCRLFWADLLQRMEVPVYKYAKVAAYLKSAAKQLSSRWGPVSLTSYRGLPPVEVLQLAKRIKDEAGKDVPFYVLGCHKDPDPFLSIYVGHTTRRGEPIEESTDYLVIAHWDEPGFKLIEEGG